MITEFIGAHALKALDRIAAGEGTWSDRVSVWSSVCLMYVLIRYYKAASWLRLRTARVRLIIGFWVGLGCFIALTMYVVAAKGVGGSQIPIARF